MKGNVSTACPVVILVTAMVLVIGVGFLLAAAFWRTKFNLTQLVAAAYWIFIVGMFLRVPVAYELDGGTLTIKYRAGSVKFGPVSSCRPTEEPVSLASRSWGNGGLFAFTGTFRNEKHGVFKAYVTDPKRPVLVQTDGGEKVFISPENPQEWVLPGVAPVPPASSQP